MSHLSDVRISAAGIRLQGYANEVQPASNAGFERTQVALAKILIVDDESAVLTAIRLLLERAGHTVVVAGDGRKGFAIFDAEKFDLLVLDIFMPGMDGLEMIRLIHQRGPLIPIVVISSRPLAWEPASGPDFPAMATKLGEVRSLQKPFKPADLLATVAGCLDAAKRPPSSFIQAGDSTPRP